MNTALDILLVEDDESTLLILSKLLTRIGYRVQTADCISRAMQVIDRGPIDILISDIGLPDGTGYQLMRQVRDRSAAVGIALTGYDDMDDLDQSSDAGFAGHLVKPIDFNTLKDLILRVQSA